MIKHFLFLILSISALQSCSQAPTTTTTTKAPEQPKPVAYASAKEGWLVDLDEAYAISVKEKKPILANFTGSDWCGWCKRMDKSTFADSTVSAYLAANFYPVKLNAEQKADIQFNGQTFKYMDNGNGRGVHTLAYSLLEGQMGYPCFVYLNEKYERIMISPGYKEPNDIMTELKFAAEEHYNKTTWEKYKAEQGGK